MDSSQPHQGFVAPTPEELAPLFPAYEVQGFIAAGGMGAVYQAQQRSLDRPVAIKILPREFGADEQFRASFEAEAKAMARLNHPNLIGVYDFGDIDGMLFIIMELVAGKSLHHSAHGTAIEQKEAARIVAGMCRGLAHAHQAGILHRDIKPANILLTPDAQPKIGDFGLARPVGHQHGENELVFGTPGYSAPEVLKNPAAVGERTDLYAVGVVLYELLTGRLPAETWTPPSALGPVDQAFDAIVRRATHPSPELRYSDANEMGDELEELAKKLQGGVLRTAASSPAAVRSTSPLTRPVGTHGRPAYTPKQTSTAPVFAVITILVIGLIGLVIALGGGKPEPQPVATNPPPVKVIPPKPKPKEPKEPRLINTGPNTRPERGDRPRDRDEEEEEEPEEEEVVQNDPMPTDPVPDPVPEPEPVPNYPDFDTVAFIDKGRTVLQQKAAVLFAESEEQHAKNIDRYKRAVDRAVRKLDRRWRDPAEDLVDGFFEEIREVNRVPGEMPRNAFDRIKDSQTDLREAYEEAIATQQEIEVELENALVPLQTAYVDGLRKKAAELLKLGNTPAEAILVEEAEKSAASLERFVTILQGGDPDAGVPEEGEEDGGDDN